MKALLALVGILLTPVGPPPRAVDITLDLATVSAVRGEQFTVESHIVNRGSATTEPLIAYLNVANLTDNVSVDPEDWSPRLTVSPPVHVAVVGQNPLTTEEVLPVVVAVPVPLGVLAVVLGRPRNRRRPRAGSPLTR